MFDLTIQLASTNALLERIANALERAVGPGLIPKDGTYKKRGPASIVTYGNQERSWLKENAASLIQERGLPPELQEQMLNEAMEEYDQSVNKQALDPEGEPSW